MSIMEILLVLLGLYLAIGVAFALWFVFSKRGVGQIDPVAQHGTIGFRMLILPGCAALWPLLAGRSWHGAVSRPASHTDPAPDMRRTATWLVPMWPAIWFMATMIILIGIIGRRSAVEESSSASPSAAAPAGASR